MMPARVDAETERARDAGSAVTAALVFALIVGVVAAMAATRTIGSVSGSLGAVDRATARTLSELAVTAALAELGDGSLSGSVRAGRAIDATVPVDVTGLVPPGSRVVTVVADVRGDVPRERVLIEGFAAVGPAEHRTSIVARPLLSVDAVWLTEHEVVDPALLGAARSDCAWSHGDSRRDAACLAAALGPGSIRGPVHSNDALDAGSASWLEASVSTAFVVAGPEGHPVPTLRGSGAVTSGAPAPTFRPAVGLPRTIAEVAAGVDVTCRFRGPTLLRFDGTRVRVTSPGSVPRAGDATDPSSAFGCLGIDRSMLDGVVELVLPERAVIEVVRDDLRDCVDHPLGLTREEDFSRDWWCNGGDAFVWGRYRGARTVLAEDSVQIVWDLEPGEASGGAPGADEDLLGLVAGDSIVIRRPVTRPVRRVAPFGLNVAFAGPDIPPFGSFPQDAPVASAVTWDAPRIVASLAALRGSVTVQNPFLGVESPGPLSVEGSIAGRFSGVYAWEVRATNGVVLGRMGYPIAFGHDERLTRVAPPAMPVTDGGRMRVLRHAVEAP
jgi:hypothetical protein